MRKRSLAPLLACALLVSVWAPRAHADLRVALTPAAPLVTTGQEFDLFVDVTGGSDTFNGFDFVVTYDPNALTLLPATPSKSQEGCLMTGTCSGACGTTYHQFQSAGDSASVTDVLLCNKVALSGPGRLYRLHFRAKPGRTPRSPVSIRRARFFNGGLAVTTVTTTDAMVLDPALLGVGDAPTGTSLVRIEPNPSFGRTQLVLDDAGSGLTRVDILDAQGRLVRHLTPVWTAAHARLEWDGADGEGRIAPGGIYLARIERGGVVRTSRFVRVR